MEQKNNKKRNAIILSVTAGVVVVGLAVGLGIGLGLGNKGGEDTVYSVTKEEWESAFDFTDKNCTVQFCYSMTDSSESNGETSVYFTGENDVWANEEGEWEKYLKETISEGMNQGCMFFASEVYDFFKYDETTHSYKSTESWYSYLAEKFEWGEEGEEVEDRMQLAGEVKFEDKKLVFCAISMFAAANERVTYTTTVTNYGATVTPAEVPAEEE